MNTNFLVSGYTCKNKCFKDKPGIQLLFELLYQIFLNYFLILKLIEFYKQICGLVE